MISFGIVAFAFDLVDLLCHVSTFRFSSGSSCIFFTRGKHSNCFIEDCSYSALYVSSESRIANDMGISSYLTYHRKFDVGLLHHNLSNSCMNSKLCAWIWSHIQEWALMGLTFLFLLLLEISHLSDCTSIENGVLNFKLRLNLWKIGIWYNGIIYALYW